MFRWSLSHVPGKPFTTDVHKPFVGHFEIKAHDFEGQKAFYCVKNRAYFPAV
jgi:hypothetical protein